MATPYTTFRPIRLAGMILLCFTLFSATNHSTRYKCLPCGLDCDNDVYKKPGQCSKCHMALVKASTITFKTIEPAALCSYVKSHPETVLLDVRTKEEFEGTSDPNFGSLKNAVNIPIQELESRLPELESYKNRELIVYCSHSHRSPQAAYLLTQQGFKHVWNMAGGMSVMEDNACKTLSN